MFNFFMLKEHQEIIKALVELTALFPNPLPW